MEIILNILVISLLIITISFCWKLNKKIIELKDSKKDLGELVKTFDNAIIKTHKSIADLKVLSSNSSTELQQYVNKAGEFISDLSFMTDTAAKLADRLEKAISNARHDLPINNIYENKRNLSTEIKESSFMNINIDKTSEKPNAANSNYTLKAKEDLLKTVKLIKNG